MCRFLQWLGHSRHTAAGTEDVAADLIALPHEAVLVGLADLGEELEAHLVFAWTIEAMAQIGGCTFILLLIAAGAVCSSRSAGERQGGQSDAEWTICANRTSCCACRGCLCWCCCCWLDGTSGRGLLLLAIAKLLLLGIAHRRMGEFLWRMWRMRWLWVGRHTDRHNALTAETPEIRIEEIEPIGQTRTWCCACER